ncbi:hypothetical protein T484DRAFT_1845141 [Baffinella frigidus]|nr:hypothetical protein T484DRAFT_1845141 [Cryptophyta sp. CCMP2293]
MAVPGTSVKLETNPAPNVPKMSWGGCLAGGVQWGGLTPTPSIRCMAVPGTSVKLETDPAPNVHCLGGDASWGACNGGEFLSFLKQT